MEFTLKFPGSIIFGENSIEKLGENTVKFGEKCILVTGGKSIKESGALDNILNSLSKAGIDCLDIY